MRFVFLWVVLAVIIYMYRYVLSKKERNVSLLQTKNVFVSCSIATVFVGFLYLLNNIQGL